MKKIITVMSIIIIVLLLVLAVAVAILSVKKDNPTISNTEETTDSTTQNKDPDNTSDPDNTLQPTPTPTVPAGPVYINPLTGLPCSEEVSKQRPAAIMINNIHTALPQEGISGADVLYECLAEGGITRLLMVTQDYASLGVVGSVRSSREYYLDFAQNHNALYFHAGGSNKAYTEIAQRKIDNFDGLYLSMFYRDPWRLQNFALEHTLVITGEGMVNAIKYRGKTTQQKEDFANPFSFNTENKAPNGNAANCVYLPFSYYQKPYLKYDETTKTYKRWQYDAPHIDKTNNKQLEFTNIIVLFASHTGALDSSGHIDVTTTGSGDGYYISNGKYVSIKYYKADEDTPIKLFNADYSDLQINKGKTYIAIFPTANKSSINMNYNK